MQPEFLKTLAIILAYGGNSEVARRQAGLQLKNYLASNDEAGKAQRQQRWLKIDPSIRSSIKRDALGPLGLEGNRPSAAAQCIQHIAVVELPQNLWPDLLEVLIRNTSDIRVLSSTEMFKEATLAAIGYICQDVRSHCLEEKFNDILTAIVRFMKLDEPSNHVRLAATNALFNSLVLARANFEKEARLECFSLFHHVFHHPFSYFVYDLANCLSLQNERDVIMQVVCDATDAPDIRVWRAALQCLIKIVSLYYQYMRKYMDPHLVRITLKAMKSNEDEIALEGLRFWSNVCYEEIDLQVKAAEAAKMV